MRVRLAGHRCHQAIITWCVDVGPGLVGVLLAAWLAGRKAALLWPCPACQYDARYGIHRQVWHIPWPGSGDHRPCLCGCCGSTGGSFHTAHVHAFVAAACACVLQVHMVWRVCLYLVVPALPRFCLSRCDPGGMVSWFWVPFGEHDGLGMCGGRVNRLRVTCSVPLLRVGCL